MVAFQRERQVGGFRIGQKLRQHIGDLRLRNARHKADERPVDETCSCYCCQNFSRAYLHHLDRCGEMLGPMLGTVHNLHYYLQLMAEMRGALDAGQLSTFAAQFATDRARGV